MGNGVKFNNTLNSFNISIAASCNVSILLKLNKIIKK